MSHILGASNWLKKFGFTAALLCAFTLAAGHAGAVPLNLVKNGGFEEGTGVGQIDAVGGVTLAHWSSPWGYNFVMAEGKGDSDGANIPAYGAPLRLWGLNNPAGGAQGATALQISNNGGNFIANDGDYGQQALTQLITGLLVGHTYAVNFEWAAAQQFGFDGPTTEQWNVSLGQQTQSTAVYQNAEHSSSSWMQETFHFTATSTEELLAFLAVGTPVGQPPFSLLDGVSMYDVTAVPEPSTLGVMVTGLGLVAWLARRRKRAASLSARA
jgi:hypothetical protein